MCQTRKERQVVFSLFALLVHTFSPAASQYLCLSCRCRAGCSCRARRSTCHPHGQWSPRSPRLLRRSCPAGSPSSSHIPATAANNRIQRHVCFHLSETVRRGNLQSSLRGWRLWLSDEFVRLRMRFCGLIKKKKYDRKWTALKVMERNVPNQFPHYEQQSPLWIQNLLLKFAVNSNSSFILSFPHWYEALVEKGWWHKLLWKEKERKEKRKSSEFAKPLIFNL